MLGTPSARELAARLDAPAPQGTIRIDDARIGRGHRRDLGDIAKLAASICNVAKTRLEREAGARSRGQSPKRCGTPRSRAGTAARHA